jgi:hypothetical protein
MDKKAKKKRVCHSCAVSMDNILVESVRNSGEMCFTETGEVQRDIVKNPVLANSMMETEKSRGISTLD